MKNIPTVWSSEFKTSVPAYVELPCGNQAEFDQESTIGGYRCNMCGAIAWSAGMPNSCKTQKETTNA